MPSTITAYNTFVAGAKAKASEVNTNFSNHRGTLVPINENTASASDLSHDIGSSEHRWQAGYFGTIDLAGSTSTTDVKFVPQTSVSTGAVDLLFGSTTIATWDVNGIKYAGTSVIDATMRTALDSTVSALGTYDSIDSGTFDVAAITLTSQAQGNRLVICFGNETNSSAYQYFNYTTGAYIQIIRNSTVIGRYPLSNTSTIYNLSFVAFDNSAPASTCTYKAQLVIDTTFSSARITNYRIMATELK